MPYESVPHGFLGLPPGQTDYERARAVVLPVPYEGTVSYGGGTRRGPSAIIDASTFIEPWEPRLRLDYFDLTVATMPTLATAGEGPHVQVDHVEAAVADLMADGKWVTMLGGEHSITTGAVRAVRRHHPDVAVLQIDAHADLRVEYEGSPFSHASVMHRILDMGMRTVAVGIRSLSREEHDLIDERQLPVFWAWELEDDWIDRVLAELPDDVYVTFDVDGLDPAVMPGTGTPEPGGMSYEQAFQLLRRVCTERRVVGCDFVEVAPIAGQTVSEFTAARLAAMVVGLVERQR